MAEVSGADRESAARIGAVEERVPLHAAAEELLLGHRDERLGPGGDIRVEPRGLLGLLGDEYGLAGVRRRPLRVQRPLDQHRDGDDDAQPAGRKDGGAEHVSGLTSYPR